MQTVPFQFEFQNDEDLKYKPIIINVFENFTYFLDFNDFKFEKINVIIGEEKNAHFKLSQLFKTNIQLQKFDHSDWFFSKPLIIENEQKDYLGTCFYMINCLQEYAPNHKDFMGRFDYNKCYQLKFNCTENNMVLNYFQEIANLLFGEKIPLKKSSYQLSHDIDYIYSAWKHEVKDALKARDFEALFKTLLDKIKGKNTWQNIKQIIDLENKHNIKSTFFWLSEFGKTAYKNIQNADYHLQDKYIENCLIKIAQSKNHCNALHKSISPLTINAEHEKIFEASLKNRFHFLNYDISFGYAELEASKIEEDYSMGFSHSIGFRNSYGLPFKPYNPITNKQYQFTVFPLHIMDSSLYYYMNLKTQNEMIQKAEDFISKNNQSCVIGILWHNSFFEVKPYQRLLQIINTYLSSEQK